MRVYVHKRIEGVHKYTVVPGRSARLPPVVLSGTNRETVREELAAVVEQVTLKERQARGERPA